MHSETHLKRYRSSLGVQLWYWTWPSLSLFAQLLIEEMSAFRSLMVQAGLYFQAAPVNERRSAKRQRPTKTVEEGRTLVLLAVDVINDIQRHVRKRGPGVLLRQQCSAV